MRSFLAACLAATAVAFALVAVGATWARAALLDSSNFAGTAREALDAEPVRDLLVGKISDPVVARLPPEAGERRAAVEQGIGAIVSTPEFGDVFEQSVETVHRALVQDEREDVVLDLSPAADLVREAVTGVDPRFGAAVDAGDLATVPVGDDDDFPDLSTIDDVAGAAVGLSLVATVVSGALALLVSTDRARMLVWMGVGVLAAAAVSAVGLAALPDAVGGRVDDPRVGDAVSAVVDVAVGSLRVVLVAVAAVAGTGAAVAAWWPRRAIAV